MLANPVCVPLFAFAAKKFFDMRVPGEEKYLVEFFGDDYFVYAYNVSMKMPFVRSYCDKYIEQNKEEVLEMVEEKKKR